MTSDYSLEQEKQMENTDLENGEGSEYKLPAWDGTVYAANDRFFGMLGLCRRAGKTVLGTELICSQMRVKDKPVLVFVTNSASENTREKIIGKCRYYGIPFLVTDADGEVLARRLGKKGFVAAVAVTDPGLASAIRNTVVSEKGDVSDDCNARKGRDSRNDGDGSEGDREKEYGKL